MADATFSELVIQNGSQKQFCVWNLQRILGWRQHCSTQTTYSLDCVFCGHHCDCDLLSRIPNIINYLIFVMPFIFLYWWPSLEYEPGKSHVLVMIWPFTPDLPTLTRSHLWDWPYKPVRKPVSNLRRMFCGTITQISIRENINEASNCRKQKFHIFYGVSLLQSNEHQREACTFGVHMFRL